ncbi:serine peptidase-like protein [Dothidotthia symphoricarpi CBS 119687]|uniref:Serine peptidase-like protein n=1 Tax=Dothidotthia symphoricarpi CBS 119687 TaxID=1392245 RepID=A0A6A5ZY40_9PLEO|nr:serine peptidase-like protein [Dothidotthia symphoricarpi CBS 119687]KAF2124510.1 serine peptidase-like protein [Dothidotthia symphoricarpi CBS 119687]
MRFSIAVAGLLFGFEASAIGVGPKNAVAREAEIARTNARRSLHRRDDVDPATLYPEYNISVPIDFFQNETRYEPHSNGTFDLRYWFDATYYKAGGPVFVLLGGETDGADRLPFLQKGIVHQVAKATNGMGVILEHRYYGKSFPVPDLTTENMRFLSTEQALADVDYFAQNVKFEGIDADLTAPNTPWVVYGGSYAGAQAAFLRVVYPGTFWGGISSSGVTLAVFDYWQYFEPIRLFGPPDCIKNTQLLVDVVDKILLDETNAEKVQPLKEVFGLGNITDDRDFANQFTSVYGWQSTNWDPEENSASFFNYCSNLTQSVDQADPATESLRSSVTDIVSAAGYANDTLVQNITLNAISWVNKTSLPGWRRSMLTQDQYFTTLNDTSLQSYTSLADYSATSWSYQVCTEWGYIQTGNTPADIMPLIPRTLTIEYLTYFCKAQFNITTPPDTDRVNKYGNYSIDYPRLAHIGGNADPWRPATPLWYPESRNSSTEKPWLLISHAVHHWEENGLFENETTPLLPPPQIVYAQQFLKNFVVDWVEEFNSQDQSELKRL